jgi:predicted ATP-grasp superfamily ATP-dependent carboligase
LEREILSDAIRRLYEAHAEGKISEQEREKLAGSYKSRMMAVKESMAKDETIVALHELEGMQEDLMKLFSERFGDLSTKVEELRSKIDVKAVKEVPVQMPKPSMPEELEEAGEEEGEEEGEEAEKKKKRKKPSEKPSLKTDAEKRIEEIRSEVEKVLDKLGQMEIET